MALAPEGRPFILVAVLLLVGLALLGWWVAAVVWLPVAVWVIAFFRDPAPPGSSDERLIMAPADGKVVSVIETDEPAFFADRAIRVSIFMNVFDCHVNRYPATGIVRYRHYNPGEFGHAGADKASHVNEQASIGVATPHGPMLLRQIAGLVARRIVTDHDEGARVAQGQRLGMIRFGSRVDVYLPLGTEVLVRVGDRTRVARTAVARWT